MFICSGSGSESESDSENSEASEGSGSDGKSGSGSGNSSEEDTKTKDDFNPDVTNENSDDTQDEPKFRKGRGRPKKDDITELKEVCLL